ncbi:MAG TPA: cytochrome b/b6 domain-containing protein [Longimicrobiales bacterium]|nr:cytochrome b/b6 domain-containing protein [Longimicrobiales bacterium]
MPAKGHTLLMAQSYLYRRHSLLVRITHWINVVALTALLMSGLQIFNEHPALYWGKSSYTGRPAILEVPKAFPYGRSPETGKPAIIELDNKFADWMIVPSGTWLAMGRRWHFFFAWLFVINAIVYLAHSIASRHVQRDLTPTREDWRGIWRSVKDHLRLRHPHGETARRYNVLQKLSYLLLIFGLFPLVLVTGWAMSPWLNSILPGWVDFLGGRQSARTLHFIAAWILVLFVLIHVFEIVVTGFWNNLRSMITGRYRITSEEQP